MGLSGLSQGSMLTPTSASRDPKDQRVTWKAIQTGARGRGALIPAPPEPRAARSAPAPARLAQRGPGSPRATVSPAKQRACLLRWLSPHTRPAAGEGMPANLASPPQRLETIPSQEHKLDSATRFQPRVGQRMGCHLRDQVMRGTAGCSTLAEGDSSGHRHAGRTLTSAGERPRQERAPPASADMCSAASRGPPAARPDS